MDPQVVLARTPQGAEALNKPDHDLPRALRHALILIDGRSTVSKLEQRGAVIPEFPAALRELVARGLVTPVGHNVTASYVAAHNGGAPDQSLSRGLVGLAESILGEGSAKVVRKLEDAGSSREALSVAVEGCYKLIRLTIDESRAEEFRSAAKALIARSG
jgi:hypothetical protein